MTGVSDLSQKRPPATGMKRFSWIRSTGGKRTSVSVLDARRCVLHLGQNLLSVETETTGRRQRREESDIALTRVGPDWRREVFTTRVEWVHNEGSVGFSGVGNQNG